MPSCACGEHPVAKNSVVGCLSKPFTFQVLEGALTAAQDIIEGRSPNTIPHELKTFS
jgi:hypothetical protein